MIINLMKKVCVLFVLISFTSFTSKVEEKKLPNGHYIVELDQKYKDSGMNDFDFTLENQKFTMKIANKYEDLEINWIDENSFIVKGFTEPLNPPDFLKDGEKFIIQIAKIDDSSFYFTMGLKFDEHPIFAGKFIKK